MEPFTSTTAKIAAEQAVAAINAHTDFDASINGGSRFDDGRVFIKIEVKQAGALTQEQADLIWAKENGLTKWEAGDKLFAFGKKFKVTGWNHKAKKKPLIVEDLDSGKTFVIHRFNPNVKEPSQDWSAI